jgi:leader peptidase (prepilin peptidase) / N-methyltransferase
LLCFVASYFINVFSYHFPLKLLRNWKQECQEFLEIKAEETTKPIKSLGVQLECHNCKAKLNFLQNIPLLRIFASHKCQNCKTKLRNGAFSVDIITIFSGLIVFHSFGQTPLTSLALVLTWFLICGSIIDLRHKLLPDELTLTLLWLGLLLSCFSVFVPPTTAIWGAIAGYGAFYIVHFLYKLITKKEGLGFGDFKLLAAIGAWQGPSNLPFTIFIAALSACLVSIILVQRDKTLTMRTMQLPFGPYLAFAGFVTFLSGNSILTWYTHLFMGT